MTDPYAQRRDGPLRRETDWSGQRITVMGLGLFGGGLGAAAFALRLGAQVTVTDLRDAEALQPSIEALRGLPGGDAVRLVLGEHDDADFRSADIVIVNPAVPPSAPMLRIAQEHCVRVTTATELLLGGLDCRVVGITGTHGKSSTAKFTADLIDAATDDGVRVVFGGNIGGSLLEEIERLETNDVVVLEISSYQLEHLSPSFLGLCREERALDVAAITNIGIDHLARHGTREAYRRAKLRIAELVGKDGPRSGTVVVPESERSALGDWSRVLAHDGDHHAVPGADGLRVSGAFQQDNLRTAFLIGRALGLDADRMAVAIPKLRGLPHRMEALGAFTDVRSGRIIEVTDNGVSTTPESTVAALQSLGTPEGVRVVLVGGQLKRGCDLKALAVCARELGWTLAPFGSSAEDLAAAGRAAGAALVEAPAGQDRDTWPASVEEAALAALEHSGEARPGESDSTPGSAAGSACKAAPRTLHMLFSPACASFDRYPNFRERALAFRGALASRGWHPSPPGAPPATERSNSRD